MRVCPNVVILQEIENCYGEGYCHALTNKIHKENNYVDSLAYIFVIVLGQSSNENFVWQNLQNFDCVHEIFK